MVSVRRCARLGDAEVDEAARAVDADDDVLRGDVAVDELEPLPAHVDGLVRGVQARERVDEDAHDDRRRQALPDVVRRALRSVESAADSTYSMTRKSSPSASTTSMTGTTFGWRSSAATRASSRNMSIELAVREQVRVHALEDDDALEPRAAPICRATYTVAIPPEASSQQRLVVAEAHAGHGARASELPSRSQRAPRPAPSCTERLAVLLAQATSASRRGRRGRRREAATPTEVARNTLVPPHSAGRRRGCSGWACVEGVLLVETSEAGDRR